MSEGMMSKGTLVAIIILGAYFSLEAYTITKASERTRPDYIHRVLVGAQTTITACKAEISGPTEQLTERFERTLRRVSNSLIEDLREDRAPLSIEAATTIVAELAATEKGAVLQQIDELSCSDPEIKAHLKRFEIYARKTR